LLSVLVLPVPVIVARVLEGIGTGFFVAAAMSYVNSLSDHEKMSGYLMASLNAGLVVGLICAGWLAANFPSPASGIFLFSALVIIPLMGSLFIEEKGSVTHAGNFATVLYLVTEFRWLWYSSVILIGITGVVTSLYPKFSGYTPDSVGNWISIMSIATIAGVLVASRLSLPPVNTIRWSAILMVIGVILSYYSPLFFVIIGICAGVVMIAQMSFLAGVKDHQGGAMGLYSTTTYLGMSALPFVTGLIADASGFFYAFCATAFFALTVFFTIGRCECTLHRVK
jgi:MFS family permease